MANDLMAGKRGLIMGLANDKSIAWGIARSLADAGAELAFSYQGDALKRRVDPLAAQLGSNLVLPCDVGSEESIDALFETLKESW
ncbi:MAG: SDR family oxidoreductase, partial [Sulfitobacter sp. SK025]